MQFWCDCKCASAQWTTFVSICGYDAESMYGRFWMVRDHCVVWKCQAQIIQPCGFISPQKRVLQLHHCGKLKAHIVQWARYATALTHVYVR